MLNNLRLKSSADITLDWLAMDYDLAEVVQPSMILTCMLRSESFSLQELAAPYGADSRWLILPIEDFFILVLFSALPRAGKLGKIVQES